MTGIVTRPVDTALEDRLTSAGLPPFLARIYAARGIGSPSQLDADIKRLIPPEQLLNAGKMAVHLADTIAERKKLLIVADYDADGSVVPGGGPLTDQHNTVFTAPDVQAVNLQLG